MVNISFRPENKAFWVEAGDVYYQSCQDPTGHSNTNPTLDSASVRAKVSFWARRWSARLWTRSSSKRYSTRRGSRSDVEGSEVRLWASSWALELTWKLCTKCSAACVVGSCNNTVQHLELAFTHFNNSSSSLCRKHEPCEVAQKFL